MLGSLGCPQLSFARFRDMVPGQLWPDDSVVRNEMDVPDTEIVDALPQ